MEEEEDGDGGAGDPETKKMQLNELNIFGGRPILEGGKGVPDPKTKVVQNLILISNPFTKLFYEPGKWVKITKN